MKKCELLRTVSMANEGKEAWEIWDLVHHKPPGSNGMVCLAFIFRSNLKLRYFSRKLRKIRRIFIKINQIDISLCQRYSQVTKFHSIWWCLTSINRDEILDMKKVGKNYRKFLDVANIVGIIDVDVVIF